MFGKKNSYFILPRDSLEAERALISPTQHRRDHCALSFKPNFILRLAIIPLAIVSIIEYALSDWNGQRIYPIVIVSLCLALNLTIVLYSLISAFVIIEVRTLSGKVLGLPSLGKAKIKTSTIIMHLVDATLIINLFISSVLFLTDNHYGMGWGHYGNRWEAALLSFIVM
jgi:hypothetical protein